MTARILALAPAAVIALAGCAGHGSHGAMMSRPTAVAPMSPTQGQTAKGNVVFHDLGGEVMVHARLSGLKPNGEHGFHIHEKGDCSAPDATSAGGHYNPTAKPHGPQSGEHHAGDMPSLKADGSGNVDQKFTLRGVSVGPGAADIVGRGVIVHAQPDDFTTQPTGNSGGRIACGVIAMGHRH
jgi:Cu-Zn family superoxide dismutase